MGEPSMWPHCLTCGQPLTIASSWQDGPKQSMVTLWCEGWRCKPCNKHSMVGRLLPVDSVDPNQGREPADPTRSGRSES